MQVIEAIQEYLSILDSDTSEDEAIKDLIGGYHVKKDHYINGFCVFYLLYEYCIF
jgi:hypothetical protein